MSDLRRFADLLAALAAEAPPPEARCDRCGGAAALGRLVVGWIVDGDEPPPTAAELPGPAAWRCLQCRRAEVVAEVEQRVREVERYIAASRERREAERLARLMAPRLREELARARAEPVGAVAAFLARYDAGVLDPQPPESG